MKNIGKRVAVVALSLLMAFSMAACAERVPENVKEVQHKIDKALESEPSYKDLKEIQELYDELLSAEQEKVERYDKIEQLLQPSETDVACAYAVLNLRYELSNPSSLVVNSATCSLSGRTVISTGNKEVYVKIEYIAANGFGAMIDDTFYCVEECPKFVNGKWECKLQDSYLRNYQLDLLNTLYDAQMGRSGSHSEAQEKAQREYENNANGQPIVEVDVDRLNDIQSMAIDDLSRTE